MEEAKARYTKMIDNTDDIHKLATKNYVGNTSFKQDLTEKLVSMKYTEMGIDKSVVESFDPNSDGDNATISSADANVIVEKIMEDEGMLKGYLADYFSLYEKREFVNNIPKELKLNSQLSKTKDEKTLLPFIKNSLPEGYSVDVSPGFGVRGIPLIAGGIKITAPDGRKTKIDLKGDNIEQQIKDFINPSLEQSSTDIEGGSMGDDDVFIPGDDYVQ